MHNALKNNLYSKAKDYIKNSGVCRLWTAYDDPLPGYATEVGNIEDLRRVFKYCYEMGWPVIRVEN